MKNRIKNIFISTILFILCGINISFNHHTTNKTESPCVQPPFGGSLPNYQNPTFLKPYSHQRIFLQGLTDDHYFFSCILMLYSPDILSKKPSSEWKCNNLRLITFNVLWFATDQMRYVQSQGNSITNLNSTIPLFTQQNIPLIKQWKSTWGYNVQNNRSKFTIQNDADNITLTVKNIELIPQGTEIDQIFGHGFVPTTSAVNAYSFNSLNSPLSGNIKDKELNNVPLYLESVTTTKNSEKSGASSDFACVYLIYPKPQYNTMFVCGTIDGRSSPYNRGMIIYHNKTREWLPSDSYKLEPRGNIFNSTIGNTSFHRSYYVNILNRIEFVVSRRESFKNTDFGWKMSNAVRWTEEVNINWIKDNILFNKSRSFIELMKIIQN